MSSERAVVAFSIRRLGAQDTDAFAAYDAAAAWFEHEVDLEMVGEASDPQRVAAFLADPTVLFWLAESDGQPIGMLHCYVQRRVDGAWAELLLYEIGTHASHRRRGVGRALLEAMEVWMLANAVDVVWVPAASTATSFYEACGYVVDDDGARVMSKTLRS